MPVNPSPQNGGNATKAGGGIAAAALLICLPFTANNEGCRLRTYLDPAGIPTICYGETAGVTADQVVSRPDCDKMLNARLGYFSWVVQNNVTVALKPPTLAALTDFTYNVGADSFRRSTLLKMLNSGNTAGACDQLLRWTQAKGKVLAGLVARRAAERQLCLQGA